MVLLLWLIKDKLIDFDGEENSTKVTRFANYLRSALPGSNDQVTVLAAKALGTLGLVDCF